MCVRDRLRRAMRVRYVHVPRAQMLAHVLRPAQPAATSVSTAIRVLRVIIIRGLAQVRSTAPPGLHQMNRRPVARIRTR